MPDPATAARPTPPALAATLGLLGIGLLSAACATQPGAPRPGDAVTTGNATQTRVVSPTSGSVQVLRTVDEDAVRRAEIAAPADSAWAALQAVYGALEIPTNLLLSSERRIGAERVRARGRFAGLRLSRVVSCGNNRNGGDNADVYDVLLTVNSTAGAGEATGTTLLASSVTGTATDGALGGDPVRCVSAGGLEDLLAARVRARLGVNPPR